MTTDPARAAFDAWLDDAATAARTQSPGDELLAEHHVMRVVVAAMEAEAERMLAGAELRPGFWADVVDFNGNFVHLCHRVKEETNLLPALAAQGLVEANIERAMHKEHGSGKDLTLALVEGVGEADWEKVLRLASLYAHLLRPHMRHEEEKLFARAAQLAPDAAAQLRRDFDATDRTALGDRGRRAFVAIAVRLAEQAGIPYDLPATHET